MAESFTYNKGLIMFNSNASATTSSSGWVKFPFEYIYKESYSITPNRRQDKDSNRNANGVLVRNALNHTASTISVKTPPMDNTKVKAMMSAITSKYTISNERKLRVKYYCPDIDDYKAGDFYLADIEFPMIKIDKDTNKILYNSITLEFIEY